MSRLPILLTASVSTRGMKGADFSDEAREKMYLETLRFYAQSKEFEDVKFVFVENSGWDLSKFKTKLGTSDLLDIEFISLDPRDFDVSKGKGYNELILINQAINKSLYIREAKAFMKVTGRYPVYNLFYFFKAAQKFIFEEGGFYYGDIKDHKVYDFLFPNDTDKWNGHAAYTVLFATTVEFYTKELGYLYKECNDYINRWVECVWYDVLVRYRGIKCSGVKLRFNREPICGGLQGSDAQTLAFSKNNKSLKNKLMRIIGNFIRLFLPWFWF